MTTAQAVGAVSREAAEWYAINWAPTRQSEQIVQVSYLFMGEHGEYYGGDCMYFAFVHPHELETIVFHNVRTPELNKIAMGFLFHRLIILGRGVTEIDKQTAGAQRALAETADLCEDQAGLNY